MMSDKSPSVIVMKGITKRFGSVVANDNVFFTLQKGEIHGLLGENGAGKTTLMNILYGLHQPDSGEILINGVHSHIKSPHDTIARGIGMVHQHFMQVPTFTVIDNVILGLQPFYRPALDRRHARQRLLEIAHLYGLSIDPDAYIWQLSVGDRQRVEIIKALYRNVRILILDEPTSVLTPQESEDLFHTLRRLVENGLSVVFITHNLEEALAITDRITVLRNGKAMATLPSVHATKEELASLMVGRQVLFDIPTLDLPDVSVNEVLSVEKLSVKGDRGSLAVRTVSFSVHQGEIVGIAGVDGNGQSELIQVLAGLRAPYEGRFFIKGREMTNASPREILQAGVGYIPENLEDALIPSFSLLENAVLDTHYTPPFSRNGVLDFRNIVRHARALIQSYDVRVPDEMAKAAVLSGGNKQKFIVARALARNPQLLIAAHPTRGIDIGAEEYIRNLLLQKRKEGMAILLVSTKLDEIMSLSDRILVMERGRIMGEMLREEATIERIGMLMAGSEA
ncbi:MAG: ABC transporter ATP-binding protein [Anaerolineales bacterium]|jgi:simple sugar transport system ATP-binding protein